MPAPGPASEFGGKVQRNGIQPPVTPNGHKGHQPTASEKLSLLYRTGTEDSTADPDGGLAMTGLLPESELPVRTHPRVVESA